MKEAELSKIFQNKFSKDFYIFKEVPTDDNIGRIDLIFQYKNDSSFLFGIELKSDKRKKGNDYLNIMKQLYKYANSTFNGNKIPILLAPSFSNDFIQVDKCYKCKRENISPYYNGENELIKSIEYYAAFHTKTTLHQNMNSILFFTGAGEVRFAKQYGYCFVMNNFVLWSEKKGIHKTNYFYYFSKNDNFKDFRKKIAQQRFEKKVNSFLKD